MKQPPVCINNVLRNGPSGTKYVLPVPPARLDGLMGKRPWIQHLSCAPESERKSRPTRNGHNKGKWSPRPEGSPILPNKTEGVKEPVYSCTLAAANRQNDQIEKASPTKEHLSSSNFFLLPLAADADKQTTVRICPYPISRSRSSAHRSRGMSESGNPRISTSLSQRLWYVQFLQDAEEDPCA